MARRTASTRSTSWRVLGKADFHFESAESLLFDNAPRIVD